MVCVGDRDRERIGGVGAADRDTGEQPRDHRLHLHLVRAAGADQRFFDQPGRIFAGFDARAGQCGKADAARMCQLQRGLRKK